MFCVNFVFFVVFLSLTSMQYFLNMSTWKVVWNEKIDMIPPPPFLIVKNYLSDVKLQYEQDCKNGCYF